MKVPDWNATDDVFGCKVPDLRAIFRQVSSMDSMERKYAAIPATCAAAIDVPEPAGTAWPSDPGRGDVNTWSEYVDIWTEIAVRCHAVRDI